MKTAEKTKQPAAPIARKFPPPTSLAELEYINTLVLDGWDDHCITIAVRRARDRAILRSKIVSFPQKPWRVLSS